MTQRDLERIERALTGRQRAVAEWEAWRQEGTPDASLRRSIPASQVPEFNQTLARLNGLDDAARILVVSVDRAVNTAEAWSAPAALWRTGLALDPLWGIAFGLPEGPERDQMLTVLTALDAAVMPGTASPDGKAADRLPAFGPIAVQRLTVTVHHAWRELRVVELEAEEAAAELRCPDALAVEVREALTHSRARLGKLADAWPEAIGDLPEPDDALRDAFAAGFRLAIPVRPADAG